MWTVPDLPPILLYSNPLTYTHALLSLVQRNDRHWLATAASIFYELRQSGFHSVHPSTPSLPDYLKCCYCQRRI